MKIGIVSDAHGNESGLRDALGIFAEAGIEKTFFLGDAVGYFPDPQPVLDILHVRKTHALLGNHDAMVLGYREPDPQKEPLYQIRENQRRLSKVNREELAARLPYMTANLDGRRLLFVHGSPWDPLDGYVYPDSEISQFQRLPFEIVLMGHTHRPFVRRVGDLTLANVGSCGLPRDGTGRGSAAIYDTRKNFVELIDFPLDIPRLLRKPGARLHPRVADRLTEPQGRTNGEGKDHG